MAGGKETPRQKMISLMYLVLIVLMAMNISAAVLDKFFYLDKSLKHAVEQEHISNNSLINNMKTLVAERGNKSNEAEALKKAIEVREGSEKLSLLIKKIRESLQGEIDEKTGKPKKMKDTDITANIMMGPDGKSGQGYTLEKEIDKYVDLLNSIYPNKKFYNKDQKPNAKLVTLTPSAKEDPELKNDDHQLGKDWVQVNFEGSPVIAALATLSEKESKIVEYEHKVLRVLGNRVGATDISFDKVVGMSRLKSSVVAAGTELEGEIFVTAFSSTLSPKMTLNGQALSVVDGMGTFKRKVSATNYDKDGFSNQSYNAAITLKDTTLKFKVDYVVSKPVIQVQSSSVQALYRNCGNELTINVPALGSFYNPTFTLGAGEGVVRKNPNKKSEVVIIPSKKTVNLTVMNEGNRIGTEKFGVRLVPKPEIQVLFKGKPVDQKRGVTGTVRSLTVKALPDPSFAQFLPKDAKYAVTSWEALLVRGKRPVDKKTFTSGTGTLNFNSKPGDRILIEVKKVARKTYTGASEQVFSNGKTEIINIPLN